MSSSRSIVPTISNLRARAERMQSEASEVGTTDEIVVRATSMAEAERKGKAELRRRNKNEVTGSLTLRGSMHLVAGATVTLRGFGVFDGQYMIETAKHSVTTSGYVTSIDVRRVLEGY